jgi:flavin reductase (DIM6/NTAB) family NADH-FMN oxidoreductase RutF
MYALSLNEVPYAEREFIMDAAAKKTALHLFTYGLYAVTAKHGDTVSAMTVNWLTQASFDPPMVALAVEADSHSRTVIEASGEFAVNVYASEARGLAGRLGRTYAKHPEKVTEINTEPGPVTGSPLLLEALASIECRVTQQVPSGDHILFLAEVVEAKVMHEAGSPLTIKDAGFSYAG